MHRVKWFASTILIWMMAFLGTVLLVRAKENETIRVAYSDFDGYLTQDERGEYSGYGYDYLKEIALYTGWNYEFVKTSWNESMDMLERGEVDLVGMAQYSEERARRFEFSQYEEGTEYMLLLVPEDAQDVYYEDFQSFNGMRIAGLEGSQTVVFLEEYAKKHQFSFELYPCATNEEMEEAIADGKADAMVSESLRRSQGKKIVARFEPSPYYFMTGKGNTELLQLLNEAMSEIQTTDINYDYKLYQKNYESDVPTRLAFTREEAEYIGNHHSMKVAYNKEWMPVAYQDSKKGKFSGICASLMNLLSKESGIEFEYIPAETEDKALEWLQEGKVDLLCGFSENYEPEDGKEVQFTKSFVKIPVTLGKLPETNPDMLKEIAIPKNCTCLRQEAEKKFPKARIVEMADTEACVQAVSHRRVDAVYENMYVLNQLAENRNYGEMETLVSMQEDMSLSIALPDSGNTMLCRILNKLIMQLGTEETNQIIVDNTMEGPQIHLEETFRKYMFPVILLFLILLFVEVLVSKKRMEKYAFVERLTGYDNEPRFLMRAEKLLRNKGGEKYALVSLDVDKFKLINNIYSFEIGNQVLKKIADVLHGAIGDDEIFCRKADDHFLLMLKRGDTDRFDERLRRLIDKILLVPRENNINLQYTVSCGVCYFKESGFDVHKAIGWASMARKNAKALGKSEIVYYDSVMKEKAVREQEIENNMEAALENHEFFVNYQPQVCLENSKIIGAEALVRWRNQEGKIIYPDDFIPLFEKNGFVLKLDLYVFEQVCIQMKKWHEEGYEVCPISVNVSQLHLNQKDFYLQYLELMNKYQVPNWMMELELTESTIFENKEQMVALINDMKEAGIVVAMDDFGSGYSSLNLLKDLPIDFVKLDKEFFDAAADTRRGKEVIESVVSMTNKLHMNVVAEGVETEEQVEFLRQVQCKIVQGYYYYKPMEAEKFQSLLKKREKKKQDEPFVS